VSGDIFNSSNLIHKTWEFKLEQNAIRSIVVPYLFYGIPLLILKQLQLLFSVQVQATTLIYFPRIFMTMCSLLIDFSLFKLSNFCGLDGHSVVTTFATSYLAFVFIPRSFSNSIETILFSLLLMLIIESMKSQYILNDKFLISLTTNKILSKTSPQFNSLLNNEKSDEKVKNQKIKRLQLFDIYKYDHLAKSIGFIFVLGVFNRPTFVIFSFIPIVFWFLNGLVYNCNSFKQFLTFLIRRMISFSTLSLPLSILITSIDTCYYLNIKTIGKFMNYIKTNGTNGLISTPYNFFCYNSNKDNVKSHGAHPFYQHSLINCFQLFGLNYLIIALICYQFKQQNDEIEENTDDGSGVFNKFIKIYDKISNNTFCFILFTFLVPLIVFSMIPHQEARFLLPLIIPICLLTGHCTFGKFSFKLIQILWILFNLISLVIFGYGHQGGIVPCLIQTQKIFTHIGNLNIDQHVIFYKTYMPPTYLAIVPYSVNCLNNLNVKRDQMIQLKKTNDHLARLSDPNFEVF
jgi:GPI mannosyltransferase 4